jgi:hypothetical protein
MEAYGKEDKFGNEDQNFNKPSTIHFSLQDFKLQKISHACTIQAN